MPGNDHAEAFHKAHLASIGHRLEQQVELVNLRLDVRAVAAIDSLEKAASPVNSTEAKMVYMMDLKGVVPIHKRRNLQIGVCIKGPVIVTESGATSWIKPGWSAYADEWGNLRLERVEIT